MNALHESVWAAIAAQNPRAAAVLAATSRQGRAVASTTATRGRNAARRVGRAWRSKTDELAVVKAMKDAGVILKTPLASRARVALRLGFEPGRASAYKEYGPWVLVVTRDTATLQSRGVGQWTFSRLLPPNGASFDATLKAAIARAWDVVFGTRRTNRAPRRLQTYGARLNATTLLPSANEYRRLSRPARKSAPVDART